HVGECELRLRSKRRVCWENAGVHRERDKPSEIGIAPVGSKISDYVVELVLVDREPDTEHSLPQLHSSGVIGRAFEVLFLKLVRDALVKRCDGIVRSFSRGRLDRGGLTAPRARLEDKVVACVACSRHKGLLLV